MTDEDPSVRLKRTYGPFIGAFACFIFGLQFIANYSALAELEKGSLASTRVWRPVAMVYDVIGSTGVLVLGVLLLAGGLIACGVGMRARSVLRSQMGVDAYDQTRLDEARKHVEAQNLLRKLPAHLESLEAFRAYNRRLKILFMALVTAFALVGIAALLGLLR